MIFVIATIETQPDRRTDFISEFLKIVPEVLAEEGCIEYGPTIDAATNISAQPAPRENVVTIVEKWESLEALEAHLVAPHMIAYRKRVKDMVAGTSLQILQPAG